MEKSLPLAQVCNLCEYELVIITNTIQFLSYLHFFLQNNPCFLSDSNNNKYKFSTSYKLAPVIRPDYAPVGAVVEQLKINGYTSDDAGTASQDVYDLAKADLYAYTSKTSHSERLKKLGIEEDIKFCLQLNITTAIPVLNGEKLESLVW